MESFMKVSVILLALALAPAATNSQPVGWSEYVVPESGVVAQIPTAIFSQDIGAPEDGYGRRFVRADGQAKLTVQSVPNIAGDSPATFLAKKHPPSNIVYRRVTRRFFVVSSYRDDKIWYNRCSFAGRFVNCVLIDYPAAEKRQWDSVVTRISNTLTSR